MKEVIEVIYRETNGFDKFKITKSRIIKGCYKAMELDGHLEPSLQPKASVIDPLRTISTKREEQLLVPQ